MGTYRVKDGDCISSIAQDHGLFWEAIWNHSDNSKLKSERKDPNALLPGDKIFVPDKEIKQEEGATDTKHRFRALGVPAKMKVKMLLNDEPRANAKYRLYIDNVLKKEGETDSSGFIEESIPPTCRKGKIVMTDDQGNEEQYPFDFGSVDPIDTEDGVKKRLFNLGYDTSESLSSALGEFQETEGLDVTNSINDETRSALEEKFGE